MCSPLKVYRSHFSAEIRATSNEIERVGGYQILSIAPYENENATVLVAIIGSNLWQASLTNWH